MVSDYLNDQLFQYCIFMWQYWKGMARIVSTIVLSMIYIQ